jgi:hypothetical protein
MVLLGRPSPGVTSAAFHGLQLLAHRGEAAITAHMALKCQVLMRLCYALAASSGLVHVSSRRTLRPCQVKYGFTVYVWHKLDQPEYC